jgi:hypothetical protein
MVQPSDLPPLAQDATLAATNTKLDAIEATLGTLGTQATEAAILAELQSRDAIKATQAVFNMALLGGYTDSPVPLGTLTTVTRVKVSSITGAPNGLSLKMGATTEAALDLNANSDWMDIEATALFFSGNQTANSVVTLQLWGR